MNLPTKSAVPDVKPDEPYDPDITIGTTPPDSPPSLRSPVSYLSSLGTSVPSNIHTVITPPASTDFAKITSSAVPTLCGTSSTTATPLQTILNTIFGKSKQSTEFTMNTSETPTAVKEPEILSPIIDPIVQQYKQTTKTTVEFDNNDRPYDPEEEYDPALGYQNLSPLKTLEISKPNSLSAGANDSDGDNDRPYDPEEEYNLGNNNTTKYTKPSLETSATKDDVAYDPEDDTVFEEMQNYLTDNKSVTPVYGTSLTTSLSEQQKMLEDLNRQIEEQKRQLEEQEEALRLQRAAVGVSMAHFSVSDALMSPPPRFGREPDEEMEKTLNTSAISLNRDPRQYRHLGQNAVNSSATGHTDKENSNERAEVSKSICLANKSLESDLTNTILDKSLDKLEDKTSISADATVLRFKRNSEKNANLSLSKPQEGSSSSSGNKNIQHSHSPSKESGKLRQSCTSRGQYHSSPQRRSRHETRRSYHEKRTSDQSKDGHHRRGRHSPERSTHRSHSRSRKNERDSSRERERHHHRSTSSRHNNNRSSSRRDSQYLSSRSRSTWHRTSPELENNLSNQKEKSASRQKQEIITESTDSTNNVASEKFQIQSDKSKDGETKFDISKPETGLCSHIEQTSSDLHCDNLSQKKQLQLEPNQIKENPMQRENFHKNKPQSEKLSLQHRKNNGSCNPGHRHGSQKGNMLRNNETDFSHDTNEQSSRWESDHFPQKTLQVEKEDFSERDEAYSGKPQNVLPQRPPYLRVNDPEIMPPKKQRRTDDTLHPRDVDSPELVNDIHRNTHPRDQFRASEPEDCWRAPQQRIGGPRSHTPMQPRIPKAPHPEQFESCRPTGPRCPRPRIFDNCRPSPDFRPRGPTSAVGRFEGSGPRSLRPRGPNMVTRMFEEALPHPSGLRRRFPRPGMVEGAGPQHFGPKHEFPSPDMFDVSENFAGSLEREFDHRDPDLHDDSWGYVPSASASPLSEFSGHPRACGPPQQFHENMLDSRDSEQLNCNDSRHCEPLFDEAEIVHLPHQYSDDPRDYGKNFANESFLNPHESTGHRNQSPCPMQTRISSHARNRTRNQPEEPQFPRVGLNVKRSYPYDDFSDQSIERETSEPHLVKTVIFKGGRGSEKDEIKSPHFPPPQNLRGRRAPSPHFCDQRTYPPRNTGLPEDKPCSPRFPLSSTSKPPRPQGPNAGEFQNQMQSRIRLDGSVKKPDIRPLRLSGPLLPTPPGGPIRFLKPRTQRP